MSAFRAMQADLSSMAEALAKWEVEAAALDNERAERERKEFLEGVESKLNCHEPDLAGYVKKALITDPDLKLYGPSMCKRILAAKDDFDSLRERHAKLVDSLSGNIEELNRKEAEERELLEAKRLEEEARKKAAEEAELQRLREEIERKRAKREQREAEEARLKAVEDEKLRQERELYDREQTIKRECEGAVRNKDFGRTLKLLKRYNHPDSYRRCVAILQRVLFLLHNEPSDPRSRHLKRSHTDMKELIAANVGVHCLRALGYEERMLTQPVRDAYMVLDEPSDLDQYQDHLEFIETMFGIIDELNDELNDQ